MEIPLAATLNASSLHTPEGGEMLAKVGMQITSI